MTHERHPPTWRAALALAFRAAALVACAATAAGCASAAGARLAPDQAHASDAAGADVALADTWREHPATVLVWWASTCPCVARYRERVATLAATWQPRGAAFLYVASNADDGPAEVAAAAASAPIRLVRDPGGAIAEALGVISTPSVVVLDRDGVVRFRGWIDNEHAPGDPDREAWLDDALAALLQGDLAVRATPTWGCTITRSLGEPKRCTSPPRPVAPAHHCGGLAQP